MSSLITALLLSAAYYVDSSAGLDTSPGTQAEPFKTIAHAVTVVANGDTIQLTPGVFDPAVIPSGVTLQGVYVDTGEYPSKITTSTLVSE